MFQPCAYRHSWVGNYFGSSACWNVFWHTKSQSISYCSTFQYIHIYHFQSLETKIMYCIKHDRYIFCWNFDYSTFIYAKKLILIVCPLVNAYTWRHIYPPTITKLRIDRQLPSKIQWELQRFERRSFFGTLVALLWPAQPVQDYPARILPGNN